MLIVGASMIVVLRAGLWIAGQRPPAELNESFRIAAILLLGVIFALIAVAVRGDFKRALKTPTTSPAHSEQPVALQPRDALCSHLLPIALTMRNEGVQITHQPGRDIQANCQVDSVKLALMFGPTTASLYVERHDIDRSYHDPKTALLWRAVCDSRSRVVHADAATEITPWFPKSTTLAHLSP